MNGNRKQAAFTLIELLVVVAILALLVAILIPALGAARSYSTKTATTAQMQGIATACESYYQSFQSYPGVLSDSGYDNGASTVAFSATQSMMVSLGRSFVVTPLAPPPTYTGVITGAPLPGIPFNFYTSDNPAITPKDYSVGTGRPYDPLLNPPTPQLSPTIGLLANSAPKATDVPVVIDNAYGGDALPILYYRAARKYDPSIQDSKNRFMNAVGDSGATGGTAPFAAFYGATNDWIFAQQGKTFASPIPTPSGTFQNCGSLSASDVTQSTTAAGTDVNAIASSPKTVALQQTLFNQYGSGTNISLTAKGGFVLVSAGPDRIFGPRSTLPKTDARYSATSTTADDIVVAGGN